MASVSDLFNRADSTALGADWAEDTDFQIVSNTLRDATGSGNYKKCRWVGTPMDSNNYDSEVDGRAASNDLGFGAFGRGAVSAVITYYAFEGFGGDSFYLVEVTAGVDSIIATGSACTASTTFNARLRCNGSALTGFRNDVSDATGSDSSLASGAVGCVAYGPLNGVNSWIDNFAAADLVAVYTKTGGVSSTRLASGVDANIFTETGSAASPRIIIGADADVFVETARIFSPGVITGASEYVPGFIIYTKTGLIAATAQINGIDANVFGETGFGAITAQVSGSDANIFNEVAGASAPSVITGASEYVPGFIIYTKIGSIAATMQASGADSNVFEETGAGIATAQANGADANVFGETGFGAATAQISGADSNVFEETGTGIATAQIAGADSAVANETGGATATTQISGADVTDSVETGGVTATVQAAGADANVFTETSVAVSPGVITGSSSAIAVYEKTGAVTSTLQAAGVDVVLFIESGGVIAPAQISGEDVSIAVESGGVISPSVVSATRIAIFEETGSATAPAVVTGANVYEPTSGLFTKTGGISATMQAGSGARRMVYVDNGAALLAAAAAGLDSIVLNKTGIAIAPAVVSARRIRGIGGTIPVPVGIDEYVLVATEEERQRRINQDDEEILFM
ncbi:MAG TPA: hypothetical protein VII92_00540, partial [Anaerolineae bacterium]